MNTDRWTDSEVWWWICLKVLPCWRTTPEQDLSAFVSSSVYCFVWSESAAHSLGWPCCRCRGCSVPSCGGSSCPSPSPSDSCMSWPAPSTAEQQPCWRAACHILLCLGPLWDMWSCWHELMALGGVKISFSHSWDQGEDGCGWAFENAVILSRSLLGEQAPGTFQPVILCTFCRQSFHFSWFNEDAEVTFLQGISSLSIYFCLMFYILILNIRIFS